MENIVHLCDCIDYMRTLPDKAFNLAIVDPPYGINVGGAPGGQQGPDTVRWQSAGQNPLGRNVRVGGGSRGVSQNISRVR